jgi:hypothetical protein
MHSFTLLVAGLIGLGACQRSNTDQSGGQWFFRVDTIQSEVRGTVRYVATLQTFGKEGLEGVARMRTVGLYLNCQSAMLLTDQTLARGAVNVLVKRDTLLAYSVPGYSVMYSGQGMVSLGGMKSILDSLRGHKRVLIEYTNPGISSPTVAEFAVTKIDSLKPNFLAVCARRSS